MLRDQYNPDNDKFRIHSRKLQNNTLMTIYVKFLNKTLANQIQLRIKWIIHYDLMGLFQE